MYKILCRTLFRENFNAFSLPCSHIQRCQAQVANKSEKKDKLSNLHRSWWDEYWKFVHNHERQMERHFPRIMQAYRTFTVGSKGFLLDLKKYIVAKHKQFRYGSQSLTTTELQVCHAMIKDFIKMAPVIIIGAIPFTNAIILPLAYMFPRQLLTSHYWADQQRIDFMVLEHKKRLRYNKTLFGCMRDKACNIENDSLRGKWSSIIACLDNGVRPATEDVIACYKLFESSPYTLNALTREHTIALLGVHGMSLWNPRKKRQLMKRGMLIKLMDTAIQKEGGVELMSTQSLQWALSFRGLNPVNVSMDSMKNWLNNWLAVSNSVDENSISLLLHCSILLTYDLSTNTASIHS